VPGINDREVGPLGALDRAVLVGRRDRIVFVVGFDAIPVAAGPLCFGHVSGPY
jgi:hypothetical protein